MKIPVAARIQGLLMCSKAPKHQRIVMQGLELLSLKREQDC